MLALAALGAVASPMYFTRQMESLREQGKTNSPEFRKLHGQSMGVYTGEAVLLLIGGVILFAALKSFADNSDPIGSETCYSARTGVSDQRYPLAPAPNQLQKESAMV